MTGVPQWLAKKIVREVEGAFGSGMYIVNWRLRRAFGRDVEETLLTEPWKLHERLRSVHPTYADLVVRVAARTLAECTGEEDPEQAFRDRAAWERVEGRLRSLDKPSC